MLNDMGILADSVRYYHDADAFTATNLYHVPHAGSYHCDETYGMQRNYLDICQMLVVDEGELSVTYRGETRTAGPGSLILLDCREPHSYHALTPIRMRWFHFAGSGSTAYTHLILNTHGFILPTGSNAEIEECIRRIMVSVHQNQPNPHIISLTINKLLVLLVLVLGEKKKSDLEIAIQDSADYMTYNYADKSLSIEHLSQRAALSTCYYMRKFKEYQSVTPHQFLQTVRLSAAAHHLAEHRDHRG
jgi:AraC family transcriptional regulator